jgi:hypothetical protein
MAKTPTLSVAGSSKIPLAKLDQILEWYYWEPPPSKRNANAGSRREGTVFKKNMVQLLTPETPGHGIIIDTALGKSSDGKKLDGNASERVTHKMMKFKRNPFFQDCLLVISMNCAFEKYENRLLGELREHAAWLNGLEKRGQILILSSEDHYRSFYAAALR